MVRASTLLLLLAGTSCLPTAPPCGRGRCPSGACLNVITTYAPFRALEPDWWCAVPCPGNSYCGQQLCLQSPVDWERVTCAGNSLEIRYTYTKGDEVFTSDGKRALMSFDLQEAHLDGGSVHCTPGEVCTAGWYHSGEYLPAISGLTETGARVTILSNGTPGELLPKTASADSQGKSEPLGPLLPSGQYILVHLGGFVDAHQ